MDQRISKFFAMARRVAAHPRTREALIVGATIAVVGTGYAIAAPTDATFTAANAKLSAIIGGTGGAMAGSVSLTKQLMKNAWQFSGTSIAEPIGVGLMSALGTGVLAGVLTATI